MVVYDIRNGFDGILGKYSVALGRFDGVHIAHRLLLDKTKEYSLENGGVKSAVFTFSSPEGNLTGFDEKIALFDEYGMDAVFACPFEYVKALSPEEFFENVLKKIGCVNAVCGFNYRFGRGASGDVHTLSTLCSVNGMSYFICEPLEYENEKVSSTLIRSYLESGNIEKANILLGRPFSLSGKVVHGFEKGRSIGFPTLNILYPESKEKVPRGVYAGRTYIDGVKYDSVTNIGKNPTLPKDDLMIETHLINASGDFYLKEAKTELISFLRKEEKFPSLKDLEEIIKTDLEKAIRICEAYK